MLDDKLLTTFWGYNMKKQVLLLMLLAGITGWLSAATTGADSDTDDGSKKTIAPRARRATSVPSLTEIDLALIAATLTRSIALPPPVPVSRRPESAQAGAEHKPDAGGSAFACRNSDAVRAFRARGTKSE